MPEYVKFAPKVTVIDNAPTPDGALRFRKEGDTDDRLQIHLNGTTKTGDGASAPVAYPEPAPPLSSGRYYRFPNCALSTQLLTAGRVLAIRHFIPTTTTLDRIGAEITTIGAVDAVVRLGIYADDGTGRPGARLLDAGTIDGMSATVQEIAISTVLPRGWTWFVAVGQGSSTMATVRSPSLTGVYPPAWGTDYTASIPTAGLSAFGYRNDGVTGALPATFTVSALSAAACAIFGRVA